MLRRPLIKSFVNSQVYERMNTTLLYENFMITFNNVFHENDTRSHTKNP
jgi:hypothetical protein